MIVSYDITTRFAKYGLEVPVERRCCSCGRKGDFKAGVSLGDTIRFLCDDCYDIVMLRKDPPYKSSRGLYLTDSLGAYMDNERYGGGRENVFDGCVKGVLGWEYDC